MIRIDELLYISVMHYFYTLECFRVEYINRVTFGDWHATLRHQTISSQNINCVELTVISVYFPIDFTMYGR